MNTNHPHSQESNKPGQDIVDLIDDIHALTGKLDSFALSFTLAWRKHPGQQRQHFQISPQPERTTP